MIKVPKLLEICEINNNVTNPWYKIPGIDGKPARKVFIP